MLKAHRTFLFFSGLVVIVSVVISSMRESSTTSTKGDPAPLPADHMASQRGWSNAGVADMEPSASSRGWTNAGAANTELLDQNPLTFRRSR